jgi:hypothetical protein
MIKNVVLSTWEKYYNYEKNEGVWVMSTTVGYFQQHSCTLSEHTSLKPILFYSLV